MIATVNSRVTTAEITDPARLKNPPRATFSMWVGRRRPRVPPSAAGHRRHDGMLPPPGRQLLVVRAVVLLQPVAAGPGPGRPGCARCAARRRCRRAARSPRNSRTGANATSGVSKKSWLSTTRTFGPAERLDQARDLGDVLAAADVGVVLQVEAAVRRVGQHPLALARDPLRLGVERLARRAAVSKPLASSWLCAEYARSTGSRSSAITLTAGSVACDPGRRQRVEHVVRAGLAGDHRRLPEAPHAASVAVEREVAAVPAGPSS